MSIPPPPSPPPPPSLPPQMGILDKKLINVRTVYCSVYLMFGSCSDSCPFPRSRQTDQNIRAPDSQGALCASCASVSRARDRMPRHMSQQSYVHLKLRLQLEPAAADLKSSLKDSLPSLTSFCVHSLASIGRLSLFFPFDLMDQPYLVTNKLICSSCQQLPRDRYKHIPSLVVTQEPKPQHCAKVPFFPCVGGRRQGVACVHRLELNLPATARATAHQWLLA